VKLFSNMIGRAIDGGFRRLVYRTLAWTFAATAIGEVVAHGVTDLAGVLVFLCIASIVCLCSD
jgi:sorbitol-specific phosphotransferase system component IIBC